MRKLAFLLIMLLVITGVVSAQDETYVVQSGDTITGIARAFSVDPEAILIRNNIIDPNSIRRGQTLIIPTGALTVPVSHVVQPGENLTDIAIRYHTTVEALIVTNRLGNSNQIVPGQVLSLPAIGGAATFPRTYIVDTGETLRSIGEQFGVTWQQIAAYNTIANPNLIYAGTIITIPPVGYVPPVTPPATGGPVVTPPQTTTYVVQQGDTLSSIAQRFNVTVTSLAQYNNITNNRAIFAGDVLIIPPTGGPVTTPVFVPRQTVNGYYIVRAGDTLFAISSSFGVNIYTIAQANGLLNLNAIYVGQYLRIPGR